MARAKRSPKHRRKHSRIERLYKHVLRSELTRGRSVRVATRIAAATANRERARLARSGRGPRLVGRGGSRRQWYPGKARAMAKRKRR